MKMAYFQRQKVKMMLRVLLCLLVLICPRLIIAQSFNGYLQSDFSGIIGARIQPANLAGSPYKYDFSLINLNYYVTNNVSYLYNNGERRGFVRYVDDNTKFLHGNVSLGGFSGMVTLPGNESLGFSYQIRAHASAIDFTPEFIVQFGRLTHSDFLNAQAIDQKGEFASALWREFGLTYARIVRDDGFHRWKVGGTLKLVNSRGAATLRVNDLDYTTNSSGIAELTNVDLDMGYSSNLNRYEQFDGNDPLNKLPELIGNRIALDFGVVYERVAFREDPTGEDGTKRKPDIDYEFKLTASITDLGTLRFDYGTASASFNGVLPTANSANFDTLFSGLKSFRAFRDSLATLSNATDIRGTFTMSLPTSLNLGYDYNFGNNLYAGAHARIDLTGLLPVDYRLNYMHSLTLTPRWEKQKKGVYVPMYFNQTGDFQVGLAGRIGPLTLGIQSIGALLSSEPDTGGLFFSINVRQLKANAKKPYCFGTSRGTAMTNTQRTPLYRRKKWLFF